MTAEFIIGWLATCVAMLLGVPQIVRLLRTRSTEGLSLVLWQAMLTINLGWLVHGIRIDAVNMIVTNLVGGLTTVVVQVLIIRARKLRAWRVVLPGVLGAAALIAVDVWFGSAAYGVAAVIPAVIANAGQTIELIRSPRITGVSPLFLIGQAVNQALWFAWSLYAGDHGTMITAPATGVIAVFNVVWWSLRKAGLRPFFVREEDPDLVTREPAKVSFEA
ncbi:MAG: SemiSWEET family transporter [Propionicimonas sp.]